METSEPNQNISESTLLEKQRNFFLNQSRNYEREIDVLLQQIDHLEALLAKAEDERDTYKRIFLGCA